MSFRLQTIFFAAIIIVSLFLTRTGRTSFEPETRDVPQPTLGATTGQSAPFSFPTKLPTRIWDVPDPQLSAPAVLMHSLDDDMPFYYKNIREERPLASLTKLLTAVAVEEDIGMNERIPITEAIVATEGTAGNLKSGESYLARDLLNNMLLTSSNDAAAAFESYYGGTERFALLLNGKAKKLELADTVVYDGSGLNDADAGSAEDILKLLRYLVAKYPNVLYATQSPDITIEPLNSSTTKHLYNIDRLAEEAGFLGGKTGTSPKAGENLAAIFMKKNRRIAVILLGSKNRVADTKTLLDWVETAYDFPPQPNANNR